MVTLPAFSSPLPNRVPPADWRWSAEGRVFGQHLDSVIQAALQELCDRLHAQGAGLALIDRAEAELVLYSQSGLDSAAAGRAPLGVGLAGDVVLNNRPLLCVATEGEDCAPFSTAGLFPSLAAVPLRLNSEAIGVLCLLSRHTHAFIDADLATLTNAAEILGPLFGYMRVAQEAQADQRWLHAVLQATADGILAVDAGGLIELVNPAAERLLGQRAQALIRQPLSTAPIPARLRLLVLGAMTPGNSMRHRTLRVTLDDQRVLSASVSPVLTGEDERAIVPSGWVLLLHEITPLAEAERTRSAFLKAATHDMRNPLGAAMQSLAIVRRLAPAGNTALEEAVEVAYSGMSRIQHLIDDLLTLEKVQNRSEFSAEAIDMGEFAFEVTAAARVYVESLGFTLRASLGPAIPQILADRRILTLAVQNYVQNAAARAPAGSEIVLRLSRNRDQLQIEVSDTGPCVPDELHARLFERFVPGMSSGAGSAGFALAIVKAAADAHGGSVYIQSSAEGCTFGLTIPIGAVAT